LAIYQDFGKGARAGIWIEQVRTEQAHETIPPLNKKEYSRASVGSLSMETRKEQLDEVRSYLKKMCGVVQDLSIYPRCAERYTFDHVVFGTLSKAFSLADAALVLIENHHAEEAFGLSRSLVECTLNLRYLTENQSEQAERAMAFASFFFKEKQYWLAQAKEFFKNDAVALAEFDKHARDNNIVADPKPALEHWSGKSRFTWQTVKEDHPLDGPLNKFSHRKIDFAIGYHQTSAYVHGSFHAVESFFPEERAVYTPRLVSNGDEQQGQKTLFEVVRYIHQSVRYAMFGMQIDSTATVDSAYRDTLARLDPPRRLHKL